MKNQNAFLRDGQIVSEKKTWLRPELCLLSVNAEIGPGGDLVDDATS